MRPETITWLANVRAQVAAGADIVIVRGPAGAVTIFPDERVGTSDDELRKVVWPTMNELWTYFTVVVVFIIAIMAFTGVLDFAFNRAVMWLFA